jgi:NAD-dependent dihydropyrimidine dehydrogenase PreA subunit/bacterioferritin-associated ferredoxin
MIKLQFFAQVDEAKCTGCKQCEPVCPAGAIEMKEETAAIDVDRCIDCQRCIDRCNRENAVNRVPHPSEVLRYVDHSDLDAQEIKALCAKAGLLPDLPICGCTRTTGKETVAAVLKGAETPEDLCAMTGLRAGCGMYCMTRIFQVFEACGIELEEPADRRWIKLTLSIADIPRETVARIDETYPDCCVGEDWKRVTQRATKSSEKEGAHG